MRIVNIEDFFHPNAGYQINILPKYFVKSGHETFIITSEIDKVPNQLTSFFGKDHIDEYDRAYEEKNGVKVLRVPVKRFVSSRAIFTSHIFSLLEELKPDIIFVHGNDTWIGMQLLRRQKKLKSALITDSHMLEMASTNPLKNLFRFYYRLFITPKITKNHITVIRTQNDSYVNRCLKIPENQTPWISYGSDTMLFHPSSSVRKEFRAANGVSDDDFVFVYTGKLDDAKGGLLFARAIEKSFNVKRNVVFVIVGNTAGEYGKQVEALFEKSENRIIRFPTQRYVDLAKYYQSADVSIFPKQCSLSFYDAQACGLPVLFENNNINVDRCSHRNGWVFKSGDVEDMRKKIEMIVGMPNEEFEVFSNNAYRYIFENYNYMDKANEYLAEIEKTISQHR